MNQTFWNYMKNHLNIQLLVSCKPALYVCRALPIRQDICLRMSGTRSQSTCCLGIAVLWAWLHHTWRSGWTYEDDVLHGWRSVHTVSLPLKNKNYNKQGQLNMFHIQIAHIDVNFFLVKNHNYYLILWEHYPFNCWNKQNEPGRFMARTQAKLTLKHSRDNTNTEVSSKSLECLYLQRILASFHSSVNAYVTLIICFLTQLRSLSITEAFGNSKDRKSVSFCSCIWNSIFPSGYPGLPSHLKSVGLYPMTSLISDRDGWPLNGAFEKENGQKVKDAVSKHFVFTKHFSQ